MRCKGYEMARYKGTQASHLYEKWMHTLCTIQLSIIICSLCDNLVDLPI